MRIYGRVTQKHIGEIMTKLSINPIALGSTHYLLAAYENVYLPPLYKLIESYVRYFTNSFGHQSKEQRIEAMGVEGGSKIRNSLSIGVGASQNINTKLCVGDPLQGVQLTVFKLIECIQLVNYLENVLCGSSVGLQENINVMTRGDLLSVSSLRLNEIVTNTISGIMLVFNGFSEGMKGTQASSQEICVNNPISSHMTTICGLLNEVTGISLTENILADSIYGFLSAINVLCENDPLISQEIRTSELVTAVSSIHKLLTSISESIHGTEGIINDICVGDPTNGIILLSNAITNALSEISIMEISLSDFIINVRSVLTRLCIGNQIIGNNILCNSIPIELIKFQMVRNSISSHTLSIQSILSKFCAGDPLINIELTANSFVECVSGYVVNANTLSVNKQAVKGILNKLDKNDQLSGSDVLISTLTRSINGILTANGTLSDSLMDIQSILQTLSDPGNSGIHHSIQTIEEQDLIKGTQISLQSMEGITHFVQTASGENYTVSGITKIGEGGILSSDKKTVTVVGASWNTNELAGKTIVILSGSFQGAYTIQSNTEDTVTLS